MREGTVRYSTADIPEDYRNRSLSECRAETGLRHSLAALLCSFVYLTTISAAQHYAQQNGRSLNNELKKYVDGMDCSLGTVFALADRHSEKSNNVR